MATYVCIKAEFKTIDNGSNKGQEYVSAQFQVLGVDRRSGIRPRAYNFFAPTGLEEEWKQAWQPTIDASAKADNKALDDPNNPAHFSINGHVFTVNVVDHAKKYMQDTVVAGVTIPAGSAIRINNDPKHAQKFNTINVFDECTYDSNGNPQPIHDIQRIADRILQRNCILWSAIPAEAKLPADRGVGEAAVPEQVSAPTEKQITF